MLDSKTVLGEELHTKIVEKLGSENAMLIHIASEEYVIKDENLIPRSRLNEMKEKHDGVVSLLGQRDAQLVDLGYQEIIGGVIPDHLKKKAEGNEDLQSQISTLQKDNKVTSTKLAAEQDVWKKKMAIKESLLNSGVGDSEARDLLVGKFKLETVNLTDDGKVIGFDDLVKPIKENKTLATLFGEEKAEGNEHTTESSQQTGKSKTITELESGLNEAIKSNDTVAIVRLKREIHEFNQKK